MKLTRPQRPALIDRLTGAARRSAEAAADRAAAVYDRIEAAMRSLEAACEPLATGTADATALATAARAYSDLLAAQQDLRDLPPRWRDPEMVSTVQTSTGYHSPDALIVRHAQRYRTWLADLGVPVPELPASQTDWAALAQWCDDVAALGA